MVDPYFLPFDIDGRVLYHALKAGYRPVLGENPSMLSVIVNERGNQIIWMALEAFENGAYTEFYPLKDRLGGEWDAKGAELLFDDDMEGAFNHFAAWIKTQSDLAHVDLGILKVANVNFFGAFKKAYEESDDGAKIALMGIKMVDAVNEILEEGWLRFYPEVNFKKLLDLAAPALNMFDPLNKAIQQALGKLPF